MLDSGAKLIIQLRVHVSIKALKSDDLWTGKLSLSTMMGYCCCPGHLAMLGKR